MEYTFRLEQWEAELLMNAAQRQTNELLGKMQAQFSQQIQEEKKSGDNKGVHPASFAAGAGESSGDSSAGKPGEGDDNEGDRYEDFC